VQNGAGQYFVLTAAHCITTGDVVATWAGRDMGHAGAENWRHDVILINAFGGHRIFDGGVGTGEFTKAVAYWDWVYPWEWLCSSGSVSGVVCNIRQGESFTYSYCLTDSDGDWICLNDLLLAVRSDGRQGSIPGDSGGPVFSLDGPRVVAKGIISGYLGSALVHQDFGTAWRDFGITPRTGW
jgi:streptogrisin D